MRRLAPCRHRVSGGHRFGQRSYERYAHVSLPPGDVVRWAIPYARGSSFAGAFRPREGQDFLSVVNGRWLAAYSNYEHEIIGEGAGGLPPEKVEAMTAGFPTSFDNPRQQVGYELASR
jgi:hypothetical protein